MLCRNLLDCMCLAVWSKKEEAYNTLLLSVCLVHTFAQIRAQSHVNSSVCEQQQRCVTLDLSYLISRARVQELFTAVL